MQKKPTLIPPVWKPVKWVLKHQVPKSCLRKIRKTSPSQFLLLPFGKDIPCWVKLKYDGYRSDASPSSSAVRLLSGEYKSDPLVKEMKRTWGRLCHAALTWRPSNLGQDTCAIFLVYICILLTHFCLNKRNKIFYFIGWALNLAYNNENN